MATPHNPNTPIPNGPFFSYESWYVQGPYGALITGSGLEVDAVLGVIYATGGGGGGAVNKLLAGPGIALNPSVGTGNVTICNTGAIGISAGPGISVSSSSGNYTITSVATGTVTSVTAGAGLTGGIITNAGTIALNTSCVIPPTAFTAKGQLLASTTSGTYTALAIGSTPNNYVLTTDSSQPTGMRWCVPAGGSVTSVSGISPVVVSNPTTTPSISIQTATTGTEGVTQLVNNTTTSDATKALTAAQGYALQQQINSLLIGGGLILAGTFDSFLGTLLSVTTNGLAAGYVLGANLPFPSSLNADTFVIITVNGTYDPPGTGGPYTTTQGDWLLSNGTIWEYLNTGYDAPSASTTVAGQVRLATNAETQAGTVNNIAVTPAGACSTYIPLSLYPAKGSLAAGGTLASTPVSLAVGINGQVLTACSACASGLTWVNSSSGVSLATPNVSGTVYGKVDTINDNYSIGCDSLLSLTSGVGNIALGSSAGKQVNSGYCNSLVGSNSGCSITTGCGNTGLGLSSLCSLSTGGNNTAIGALAGCALTIESNNTILGKYVGDVGCSNHIWITNGNGDVRILVNDCGSFSFSASGFGTVGQVLQSQGNNLPPTWGSSTTAAATPTDLGTLVGVTSLSAGSSGIALGLNAGGVTAAGACARVGNVSIGVAAGCSQGGAVAGVAANVMIGECAGYRNTGTYNALFGYRAGSCLTGSESNNLIVGSNGFAFIGCSGVFLLASPAVEVSGTNSGAPFIYGNACGAISFRTAAATNTINGCYGTSGQFLQSRGATDSPTWAALPVATRATAGTMIGSTDISCGGGNTFLGRNINWGGASPGDFNTLLGACIGRTFLRATGSCNNTIIGAGALCSVTCAITNNVFIGACAGGELCATQQLISGNSNIAIGHEVWPRWSALDVNRNVIIGSQLDPPVVNGSCQLALGHMGLGPATPTYWLTGCANGNIRPGYGILDCSNGAGSNGQFLASTGVNSVQWRNLTVSAATPVSLGSVFGFTSSLLANCNIALGLNANGDTLASGGDGNTAIGRDSLSSLGFVTGECFNTAVGAFSLSSNQPGFVGCYSINVSNSALGYCAGSVGLVDDSVSVACNVYVGFCAGATRASGSKCNTVVGAIAGSVSSPSGCNNTLLGYDAQASTSTSSNQVVLGNANVTIIRAAQTTITALSDARDKKDVAPLPIGLEFIKDLNPVTFKWNHRDPEVTSNRGSSDMGFIAQELLEAENSHRARYFSKLVYDKNPEQLEASYGRLITVLVKAIQELSAEVDRLKEKLRE